MVSAINNAVNGLNQASKQLEVAAKKISEAGTQNSPSDGHVQPSDNVEKAVIDTNIASYNFKANLKVIQAANNNLKSLLDIKS